MSMSSIWDNSSPIWSSPLVAAEEPVTSPMILWLPSLSLAILSPIYSFLGISGLPCDSWSLSHMGYLYPGTTPVMIKLDHNKSCPWV